MKLAINNRGAQGSAQKYDVISRVGSRVTAEKLQYMRFPPNATNGSKETRTPPVEKDYIDAKIEATNSRLEATEARTRELIGSMKADMDQQFASIGASLSVVKERIVPFWKFATTVIASVAGALGIIIAILAYGGDRFDGGWAANSGYSAQVERQKISVENIERRFDNLDQKISLIAVSLSEKKEPQNYDVKNPEASKSE